MYGIRREYQPNMFSPLIRQEKHILMDALKKIVENHPSCELVPTFYGKELWAHHPANAVVRNDEVNEDNHGEKQIGKICIIEHTDIALQTYAPLHCNHSPIDV